MAFSFGNVGNGMGADAAGGAGASNMGEDLEVIQTEGLGFLSIAGEAKVQLTSKWQPPPAPTASLLSIASRKGLVAAASPDSVIIATTESVRKAFGDKAQGDSEVRPFTPQARIPLPFRLSQLAFTADEQFLILSAESGGGLAVYDVQAIVNGGTQSAFELGTSGETLRALVPNPMAESAALCAIVTDKGNLLMANLTERKLASGPNGPVLRSNVSCAAWSSKGKQLVAGMADGTIFQMTPDGTEKGHIPRPPSLKETHVESVTWLENHVFLVIHHLEGTDPSAYHLITRSQVSGQAPSFTFQKATDPVMPFSVEKPPHHSIIRLRDFPPNLQDLLLVSSTATEGVGLFSRSKTALASDKSSLKITHVFTTTELADDSRRAQLPIGEDLNDTFPIGTGLDLSSKNKVFKPIPTDEIEESPGPLPGLWVLSNEGVLSVWWIVYNESIRSGTTYPGIVGADTTAVAPALSSPAPALTSNAFASPAAKAPAFGTPATITPAFGTPSTTAPAFGTPSTAAPAFGGPSLLGTKTSPWSAATPGNPAAGSSAFGGKPAAPAFGQSTMIGLGNKASPWASASHGASTPAFGQSGFANASPTAGKVFGSVTGAGSLSGGFAGFAAKNDFASLSRNNSTKSIFASEPTETATPTTPAISMDTDTAFPPKTTTSGSGFRPSSFVLGTTFKPDPTAVVTNEKPSARPGSMFGSFGLSLDEAAKQPPASETKDEDMETTTPVVEERPKSFFSLESTTPTTTPAPQKFSYSTTAPAPGGSGLFGPNKTTSAPPGGMTNIFGTPKSTSAPAPSIFGTPKPSLPTSKPGSSLFGASKIKQEDEDKENLAEIPEAPLPPDPTISKPDVKAEDAPLPPDFLDQSTPKPAEKDVSKAKATQDTAASPPSSPSATPRPSVEDAPLPPDFLPKPAAPQVPTVPAVPDSPGSLSADDDEEDEEDEDGEEGEEGEEGSEAASEGSGVDVAKDLSPTTAFGAQTPGLTPHSSFSAMGASTFSTISRSEVERPLFGEISRNAPPLFPKPVVPQSPRSPSPVRGPRRSNFLRAHVTETPRSVSAPGMASQILGRQPPPAQPSLFSPAAGSNASQPAIPKIDPNVEAQRRQAVKREAEARLLVDPEDEGIQQILQSELEPTLQMNEFLVVDTKLEPSQASGQEEVPVACETLWRDINRMIDRLGLNSRSLQSFVLGHSTQYKQDGREPEDLEKADDWVLVEAAQLSNILEDHLEPQLEEGRVKNTDEIEASIRELSKDLTKLRARQEEMHKIMMSHVDPDQVAVAKSLPLTTEQAAQQNELRRAYATFVKLISEAEEALTVLRAKMATVGGASGKAPVPTVEAIIRTINKMTTMAEKRSGDIDVLENQMRRLRLGSVGPNGTPGPRSREGSPFVTPKKSIMSPEKMRDTLASSVASYGMRGTPTRKKVSMYSEEEKQAVRVKAARRKGTLQLLRSTLEKSGPNVSRLTDDD